MNRKLISFNFGFKFIYDGLTSPQEEMTERQMRLNFHKKNIVFICDIPTGMMRKPSHSALSMSTDMKSTWLAPVFKTNSTGYFIQT